MGLKTSLFRFRTRKVQSLEKKEDILSDKELIDLWSQCPYCKAMIYNDELKKNLRVCPKCNHHFRMNSYERIEQLIDAGTWEELNNNIKTANPLNFVDIKAYSNRIEEAKKQSGTSEAIITGVGNIYGQRTSLAVMEFSFLGGSMGSVVGERICRSIEYSIENKLPLIIISSSGGARMHEGLFSLMQMAKTSSSLQKLRQAKLLYISVLADPTYGGVSASFATLGDIIIGEPGAKIGFAGPRVIEETIRQKLPKDFQTAEYLLEHGQLDLVIDRHNLKNKLFQLIKMHNSSKGTS